MPTLCLFHGIKITMNWDDHNPPHFHAAYGDYRAIILIQEGIVSAGYLPKNQLKYVLAWANTHKDELMQNWELAKELKPLNKISSEI
ncbi:MAG: DUF4160 domain-containing protein [Clostridiales bacterium]|nr:DUF4160 domain-containing protein [Clostridiales bacterium]